MRLKKLGYILKIIRNVFDINNVKILKDRLIMVTLLRKYGSEYEN